MNYSILCIGSLKERYWKEAEQEYRKRIRRFGSWNVTELPEYPLPEHPSEKEIARALQKEGEALKHKISPQSFSIALCVEGERCSSEELAALIARISREGKSSITVLIGSSYGLSPDLKAACQKRLSISPMTFPHQMMRIILAEQFYRAHKIIAGERYHK